MSGRVDFARVNRVALARAEAVVRGLLPNGLRVGSEWVAHNPSRTGRHKLGSFKVNLVSGKWGDFSLNVSGGDLVSLAAHVAGLPQREAAIRLAESLGCDPYEGGR